MEAESADGGLSSRRYFLTAVHGCTGFHATCYCSLATFAKFRTGLLEVRNMT
jgi:hypothetical protein